MHQRCQISPYIREGSGLKHHPIRRRRGAELISPYIREGSGLKHHDRNNNLARNRISPYIREGSGLKRKVAAHDFFGAASPLTSVRGAD